MFSTATRAYFQHLPQLPGLEGVEARRLLSTAYADVLSARNGFVRDTGLPSVEVQAFLRRLAATLEASAVFPEGVPAEVRHAGAFIAAESLSLTFRDAPEPESELDEAGGGIVDETVVEEDDGEVSYRLLQRSVFEALEAALLYVVGGLETNGALLVEGIPSRDGPTASVEAREAERALDALIGLVKLRLDPSPTIEDEGALVGPEVASLTSRARAEAFSRIANASVEHVRWLQGGEDEPWEAAVGSLRESTEILSEAGAGRYADVLHLSRLLVRAIDETAARAIRRIPAPESPRYRAYVTARARSRPLVWPSGVDYVNQCLPGPHQHAAVALPTGSGKSFVAELAVSQALLTGWVLYLVPTNALAIQVRRDLAGALATLEGASVRAFVGGAEYTELTGENVDDVEFGTVLVMTPEKCALALRRSPEAFEALRLCVFDECHLISESGGRGVLAELVAAHVLTTAPNVRFLLLSAMIDNPEVATAWLEAATGVAGVPIRTPWRPTRTLRGVLGFHRDALRELLREAPAAFADTAANRRNLPSQIPYAALVNLQGAWTDLDEDEYALLRLESSGTLILTRTRSGEAWDYGVSDDGYLNPTLANVSTVLRDRGEKVLAFVPRNRHHAFSVAEKVGEGVPVDLTATTNGRLIAAYIAVADFELGAPTVLGQLIRRGVAVHSSALTDAERSASELAFQRGVANVMVATGTLAQGLNLPATAVLIAGTQVGWSADPDADMTTRVRAQLLNAIGRSGRPGVANHGLALVIPNAAISFGTDNLNTLNALQAAAVLGYEDASVPFVSRLGSLVGLALDGAIVGESMSTDEMVAYTYLPEADAQDHLAQRILRRTCGVWEQRPEALDETAGLVAQALQAVGQEFVAHAHAPAWTTEVAYRSGVALPSVFMLYAAASRQLARELPTETEGWLSLLTDVLRDCPHQRVKGLVLGDASLTGLRFAALGGAAAPPAEAWDDFLETLLRYMRGETVSALATYAMNVEPPVEQSRNVGSNPVPKMLGFVDTIAYRLSMVAGALAALWIVGDEIAQADESFAQWVLPQTARHALDSLPLAIRCGASDRSSLAWYRFGLRHRVGAHALARSFPLPDDMLEDAAVRAWVRDARREWLAEERELAQDYDPELGTALRRVAAFEDA